MKKVILLLLLLTSCLVMKAQMSRWIMQPAYDRIYIASGAPVIISDSLDSSSLWNMEGRKIATTTDVIHPFKDGYAVTTQRGTDNITGFYDTQGKFIQIKNYSIAYPDSYFSDGYLLIKNRDGYRFINSKGEEAPFGNYVKMYPFNEGFATCFTYESVEKLKNPYYTYITTDNRTIGFSFNNKTFDKDDVKFLSSLNDEGKGIAIIKHKVYYFEKATCKLEPVFANKAETNIKKQVYVDGDIAEYLVETNDSIVIKGKSGKKEEVRFFFNKLLKPTGIYFTDRIDTFKEKEVVSAKYTSTLNPIKTDGNTYAITYNGAIILPSQFDEVGFCVNDFAVVRSRGKWGMLTYDEALRYRLIMHDGKDIAFRHKDVATTIKLELPPIISADKCRFDIDQQNGCTIDKISLETKNTENGNYVLYKCVLTIPDSLPDVITEIQYPVRITYDGLNYPIVPIKTKAWHYKYINVDLDDSETTLDQGDVSFTINISADKQPGENDYPFEVDIKTDSLQTELVKISETRYKCKLYALAEGINNISIHILENGCPPSVFPFEITYVKPIKKSRNKPEVKETVKIQKKVKIKQPAQVDTPILPI